LWRNDRIPQWGFYLTLRLITTSYLSNEDSEAVAVYYRFNVGRIFHKFASKILLLSHCTS
jgi:hypothetical protein